MMIHDEFETEFRKLYDRCSGFTITSIERMYALYAAIRYVVNSKIQGAVVECGVWRGGSAMLSALALDAFGDRRRMLYLYDTYAGMSEPTAEDVSLDGVRAADKWRHTVDGDKNLWCYAPLDEVRQNMHSTGYPSKHIRYVVGKVEDTVPGIVPGRIAVLRLDTDWFESTYHEMVHLYPLLEPGGVLIVDDYGHWQGAKKAVDKYLEENDLAILLHRVDYTGRVAIKTRCPA